MSLQANSVLLIVFLFVSLLVAFLYILIALSDKFKEKHKSSVKFQNSVLKGKISEHMAPFLPGFPPDLRPSEARFIGGPIDYVVFKGLDEKNITEVVFVEVKTGRSQLNDNESMLKKAIEAKNVSFVTVRIPAEVTNAPSSTEVSS